MNAGAAPMTVNSTWKVACVCAISDGVACRSLYVAVIHAFCPISKVVRNSGTELEEVWNVTRR